MKIRYDFGELNLFEKNELYRSKTNKILEDKNRMLICSQKIRFLLFSFLLFFFSFNICSADVLDEKYTIGPGDILNVSVWKNDALTQLVNVLPDGYISFPLVGEVKAAGKTISQFKKDLERILVKYIAQPSLSVIVHRVNMKIFIIGKVKNPGMYGLNEKTNVLQALSMASGLGTFAKRNEIIILRKTGSKTKTINFMYDDVTAGRSLEQNIDMVRGDVIVVP